MKKYYMANIKGPAKDLSPKTIIAKIENNAITDIIWDPEKRLKYWPCRGFMKIHSYSANQIIINIFEWSEKERLRI